MARALKNRDGQVFLEFAISLVGVVAFIGVVLSVWVWLTKTIALRQHAFQESRIDAADRDTPGTWVPYRPFQDSPLAIVGTPKTTFDGGPVGGGGPANRCSATANVHFDNAERLTQEANALLAQAGAFLDPGNCAGVDALGNPVDCDTADTDRLKFLGDVAIPAKEAEIQGIQQQITNAQNRLNVGIPADLARVRGEIGWREARIAAIDLILGDWANPPGPMEHQLLMAEKMRLRAELFTNPNYKGQEAALLSEQWTLQNITIPNLQQALGVAQAQLAALQQERDNLANQIISEQAQAKSLREQAEAKLALAEQERALGNQKLEDCRNT